MLLNLHSLVKKYDLKISGVVHIGAHFGEEYDLYKSLQINEMLFFEPAKSNFQQLVSRVPKELCINKALGNYHGTAFMNIETANLGQSNSILEPELHLQQYPNIIFEGKEEIDVTTLDSYETDKFNLINMDVQGYELEVLKGATKTLNHIDYIISEVNIDNVYTDCAKLHEVDAFLRDFGFNRLETNMAGTTWGDAFYAKNNL
jgi:FkbM family methyltransferase